MVAKWHVQLGFAVLAGVWLALGCTGGEEFSSSNSEHQGGSAGSSPEEEVILPGGPGSDAPGEAPNFDALDPVSLDEAAGRLGDLCAAVLACQCEGIMDATVSQCETMVGELVVQAEAENAELTYDGQCVSQVMAAIEYLQCASPSQVTAYWDLARATARALNCKMFYGEGVVGAPCTSLTVSNGDSCSRTAVCEDGTCVVRPASLPAGSPCLADSEEQQCAVGLACLPTTVAATAHACVRLPKKGEGCYLKALCDVGLTCKDEFCEKLPAVGDPCAQADDLMKRSCSPQAECVGGTCVVLPKGGEACSAGSRSCSPGYACEGGTCVAEVPAICEGGSFPLFPIP